MACKIRFTDAALADLEEILNYSWINFPGTTEKFGKALLDHLDVLQDFPYIGSLVPGGDGLRQLIHTSIIIFYQVLDDGGAVEILEFRHSSGGRYR